MSYEGNEIYENGNLRMLLFTGGYVDYSTGTPEYRWYTYDHLGSVRTVADAEGNVITSYAYRPYGQEFAANKEETEGLPGSTIISGDVVQLPSHGRPAASYTAAESPDWQPFRFSGKENLTRVGLDLYDFGARMYSPTTMRWTTMDPLCEKYYSISPYAYCAGDPVNLVDSDGMEIYGPPAPENVKGTPEYYLWRKNNFVSRHPEKTPPSYYNDYGYKYCVRFSTETHKVLSDKGKIWCDEVLINLQNLLEKRITNENLIDLELMSPNEYERFVFASHVAAYKNLDGTVKLVDLSVDDLILIALTPDFSDLKKPQIREQFFEIFKYLMRYYITHPREAQNRAGELNEAIDHLFCSYLTWHFETQREQRLKEAKQKNDSN